MSSVELALKVCVWIVVAFAFVSAIGTSLLVAVVTYRIITDIFGEGP